MTVWMIIFNTCVRLTLAIVSGLLIMVLYRAFIYLGILIREKGEGRCKTECACVANDNCQSTKTDAADDALVPLDASEGGI